MSKSNEVTSVWNPHETLTRWMIFWERNFWSSAFYVKTETHFNCTVPGKILTFQCLVQLKCVWQENSYFVFLSVTYRKIPKISPEAYVFESLSLRGLFLQGLAFRGTNIWWEIYVTKLIELAYSWKANEKKSVTLQFLLWFNLYLRAISKYKPLEVYTWRGLFSEFEGKCNKQFENKKTI